MNVFTLLWTYLISEQQAVWQSTEVKSVAIRAVSWENQRFVYEKTKMQISFAVTAKLISAFVLGIWIVQYLYFLNTKFQTSSHLQWLYKLVSVRPGQNPQRWFSHGTARNRQKLMRTKGQLSGQLFPNRWSLSNPNRTKSIIT